MESKNQDLDIEIKQCFVLLERMDLDMYSYDDSSGLVDLPNIPSLFSLSGEKKKLEQIYLSSHYLNSHSENRPHECKICGRSFKTLQSYKNHVRYHTKKNSYPCEQCGASFYAPTKLYQHVRYRHTKEKLYRCAECDRAFVEMGKLKRHMQIHTGTRPHECPFCDYASANMFNLKRHLVIHTGEKPYECDVCQAQFTQMQSLEYHKVIHSQNKPSFPCDFCDCTYRDKRGLHVHVKKNHAKKPIKCIHCEKILPDRYSYKLHSKTHKKYKCDFCPYELDKPTYLKTHMYTHTGEKPFPCDECDKAFRQKQLLQNHKNVHHNPKNYPKKLKGKKKEIST